MIDQIYHTSHCGSTLLISLLKENIKAYSEPRWTHQVIAGKDNFFASINQYNDGIIKLPSGLCHFSSKIKGKKIFLYRKLKQHLFKILSNYRTEYIDYYYSYFSNNIHPSLKGIKFDTIEKQNIFLWVNRIMWIFECENITWIESNQFLLNKQKTLDFICNYLEIDPINNIQISTIHVKSIGMNHNDIELSRIIPNLNNSILVNSDYGIISDEVCYNNYTINKLLEWARKNLSFIPEYLF